MKIKTKNNGYKLNSPSLSDKYAKYKEGKNLRKICLKNPKIYIFVITTIPTAKIKINYSTCIIFLG
jgi:competence protein ComGF